MQPTQPPPCIVCQTQLTSAFRSSGKWLHQPNDGVMFTTGGTYGSTLYDAPGPRLLVVVCDLCLKAAGDAGRVLAYDPPPPGTPVMLVWEPDEWTPPALP